MQDAKLIEPTIDLQDAFTDMVHDWLNQEGTLTWEDTLDDFPSFVQGLLDAARPEKVRPAWVPCTHFWLVGGDVRIIGTSRLRHWLASLLETEGGHIGYAVCPSERDEGYGTRLLALTLQKALGRGLSRVLITCDEDSVASRRVIERSGGEIASRGVSGRTGKPIPRYWVSAARGCDLDC